MTPRLCASRLELFSSLVGVKTHSFFDAIDRIGSLDYLPTDNDCLRARVQTVGVTETEFTDRGTEFVFVDVRALTFPIFVTLATEHRSAVREGGIPSIERYVYHERTARGRSGAFY